MEGHDVGSNDTKTPVENGELQNGAGKLKVAHKGSSCNKNET